MKRSELRKCINQYQEIGNQIAALEKQKEVIAERIKRHMGDNELEQVDDFIIRYREVTSSRFDTTAFKAAYTDLYKQFTHPAITRRLLSTYKKKPLPVTVESNRQ